MTTSSDDHGRASGAHDADRRAPGPDPRTSVGLWAAVQVLLRRWPVVIIGINLTLALGIAAVKLVPVTYEATGTLLIALPPPDTPSSGAGPTPVNPYLVNRGFIGDLLITIMSDLDADARVLARGGTGSFKPSLSVGDASLVKIDTTGTSSEEAMRTWTAAADETRESLLRLQKAKDVPDSVLVTADVLTHPIEAKRQSGSRVRALIAVLVLGFGATVFTAFALEGLAQHRRLSRGEQPVRPRRRRRGRNDADDGILDFEAAPADDAPERVFGDTEELIISELLHGDRRADREPATSDTPARRDGKEPDGGPDAPEPSDGARESRRGRAVRTGRSSRPTSDD